MTTSPQTSNHPTASQGPTPDSTARYLSGAPPESDQFDFFIGDWNCELRLHPPGGEAPTTLRGEWRAKWLHDRRMLVDDLSVFLPDGQWQDGEMHLTFTTQVGRNTVQHRVRFFEITPDSFEWEWLQQVEAGADWTPFTTLSARRMSDG